MIFGMSMLTTSLLAGVPVHVVAARLGHADPSVTLRVSAHVIPRAGRRTGGHLRTLGPGQRGPCFSNPLARGPLPRRCAVIISLGAAPCRDESRDRASANRSPESFINGLVFTLKGLTLAQ